LLEEAKKNEEDYASKLAGQIRKETGYSEESRAKIIPYLSPYLGVYDVAFQRYQNKEYEFGKPEYALTALWCNYQRQYEFNPPHDHDGKLSCISYMSYFPEEGDMFIFPAWLKHWVSPFNTDCVRVSVSGNVHDSAPLNQIKKGNLKKEKTEDEEYLEELKEKL
jgi:hypothetical protein